MPKKIANFRGEYQFLSNFYPSPFVTPKGTKCQTVEHAFQAAKTLNERQQLWVLESPSPAEAKKRGRKVVLRYDWEQKKVNFMLAFVYMKFDQNPNLAHMLVETGDAYLEEGNTWNDTFWGVCRGHGKNMLGNILMTVREEIKKKLNH